MRVYHKKKDGRELIIDLTNETMRLMISQGYNQEVFKLSIDESRGLRDSLKNSIKAFDNKRITNQPIIETYEQRTRYEEPRTQEPPIREETPLPNVGSFFNNEPMDKTKEEYRLFSDEKKTKQRPELYY